MTSPRERRGRPGLGPLLLGVALAAVWGSPGRVSAQDWALQVEARAGALYSSPLAESPVRLGPGQEFSELGSVEVGTAVAPFVGGGLLFDVGYLLWAELQAGMSRSSVRGEGPGGSWEAGTLTRFHATGGLRVGLGEGLYVRGAVGFILQSAPDVALFLEDDDTGILLAAGLGYQPVETLPLSLELEVQRFDFGTTALRRAGAPDGAVGRFLLGVAWRPGAEVEE